MNLTDVNHPTNPVEVCIRLMFLRVGEIDTLNEKYQAQASIEARWSVQLETLTSELSPDDQKRLIDGKSISLLKYTESQWHPQLFIENAIGDLKEQIRYSAKKCREDKQFYICEHRDIKGLFWEKLELQHFPSDIQELSISIGSLLYNDKVILTPDPYHLSGINREIFIDQQEWSLYEHVDTQQRYVQEFLFQEVDDEETQSNAKDERKRSFLTVSCHAARRSGYFYWNGYCLVFLITICAFCTFSIPPNLPQNRLQITATLLLTSITFRWTVNRSLPTISYLTALDKYAIISIFILILLCVWHAIIGAIVFIENGRTILDTNNFYVWIDRYLFLIFCSLYSLMHLSMFIWYYLVPCGFRRRMKQKDLDYRKQLKSQRHSNAYLEKMNNKKKFPTVDIIVKEDLNGRNEINKDRILFGKQNNDWTHAIHQTLNIRRRTCTTFIPKVPPTADQINRSDIRCGCNRRRREHSWDVLDGEEIKWNKKEHTKSACSNAYGLIPNSHSHYIRCDMETKLDILAKLLFDVWKIKSPRLIMCIIGGAKYFKLNERLEREFIKGIIQAALKADGWIITTGLKTGVVQLVGEAIHDHKVTNPRSHITAIGCAKWGATRNRESLILKRPSTNQHHIETKHEKGEQDLELNHTHFLLLDDGTYYNYDIKDYRTRLVTELSQYRDANVPLVTLVVEGGPDTLATIYNDLRNDLPVVLVDGSGRVPNLLASFLTRTAVLMNRNERKDVIDIQEKEKNLFPGYEEEIRHGLRDISKGSRTSDEQISELFFAFLYCLQPAIRYKIQIFSLESDHDLDDTIFEAIIQAKQKKNSGVNREQLLQLALAWNAIEVAKEHIIKNDLNNLTADSKTRLFFEALILDRPQFVNTFIKLNFNISEMFYEKQTNQSWKLKWEELEKLYNDQQREKTERLYLLGKCHGKNRIDSEDELDRILRRLVGDYMKPIYTQTVVGVLGRVKICCRSLQTARVGDSRACLQTQEEMIEEVRELAYRDLFLWSILTNRIEMSKVILSHMETRICAALIGSKISKSYLRFASNNESKDALRTQANLFEDYASECLKSCYNYDEEKACEIAIRRLNIFGGVTCLQVAVDADDKNFVGQPCCDQLLNNIWYDKIEPFQTTISDRIRLLISICTFGLLAPLLVSFRKEQGFDEAKINNPLVINQIAEEEQEVKPRRVERLNSNGINYSDNYIWRSTHCFKPYLTYLRYLKHFHESPIVKYSYNSVSYILFLLLFSYSLLFNFQIPTNEDTSIHWTEILVILIVTTMLIEEIRQFLCQDNRSMMGKVSDYFITNQFFNMIRLTSYLLFYIGLILRFVNTQSPEDFPAAKIILAYDLELWFIRSLAFLGIAQKMGPKLVMIRKMIIDLFFFTYIILIAMIAYGVTSRAMYIYNNEPIVFDGRSIFRQIIYPTYYLMYGYVEGELYELDVNRDSSTSIATHVLLAFHMLFVNILLINLLIAMFSCTFESVQTQTDLVWRYERYSLIREYFDRPPLFPPLIFLTHLIEISKLIYRHLPKHRRKIQGKTFKMIGANREVDRDWAEFESYATNLYARSMVINQPLSVAGIIPLKSAPEQRPSSSQFQSNTTQMDIKSIYDEMTSVRKALADLRTYFEEMNRSMQWMMDAMERVKMSKESKPRLKSAIGIDG